MSRVDDLREQVQARYAALDLPSWPDPHPGHTAPADDEYSRVSDAQRYRITHERARVWVDVLGALPDVTAEALPAVPREDGRADWFDRGTRLTSTAAGGRRPSTLPLLLLEQHLPLSDSDATLAVLQISVLRPSLVLERWPDCGCDACDSGSLDVLDAIDQTITLIIGGPTVLLRGPRWQAQWHPDGGSSSGEGHGPNHTRMMDLCRRLAAGEQVRLPRDTEAVVGQGWFQD